jgi:Ca2+-binding RTX toxin-like protein
VGPSTPINLPTPIQGTIDADQLTGTSGNDVIFALAGNDRVDTGAGNDVVVAGRGNDQIRGGAGNDVLRGGAGHDRITGGSGNDVLVGGIGLDTLRGGAGNDQFVIEQLCVGEDTIVDFQVTDDVLNLSRLFDQLNIDGQAVASNNTLHDYLKFEQQGQNTVIKIDADGLGGDNCLTRLATLQNVQASSLNVNNFVIT